MTLLKVRDLAVQFTSHDKSTVQAVNGVSFDLEPGSTLGIVGESGSGKSQSVLAILGLLAENGKASGSALYQGQDLLTMSTRTLNGIRGNQLSMIFQDSMTSLNPYLTIERQMTEVLELHKKITRREAKRRCITMLEAVRIPEAAHRIGQYPHELSGGMRQRVMIAMALLCEPQVLFADEPTTALDVTVQAQVLELLRELQHDFGTAIVLITHDLGVVAGLCEKVMVMYGGSVMEHCSASALFARPSHPYTVGLLEALPRLDQTDAALVAIPGNPPNMAHPPTGCPFHPRCAMAMPDCGEAQPPLTAFGDDASWQRACYRPVVDVREFHHA
ncbi:ABC transporter ATP-binding protein [Robbsia andropogonis]|uniref:ABC transporter ATP-binding protein n=1 Tax=Robbsia andropogonis TaxID=28092 RepID=UPI0004630554|nr:oligopeptide/dipeptide ABC transporter ATP-binding protein [Robbsia andropogonis]MCP1117592.1 ATP-binding cassette domain-containing protein [Robbsia andropogonis]MCP1127058.1 ATP-binding cassette domain-containing protein [Robbsia andropogonis]